MPPRIMTGSTSAGSARQVLLQVIGEAVSVSTTPR